MATECGKAEVTAEALRERLASTTVLAAPPADGAAFICTHHGSFHADEAMACAMLKCLPEYKDLPVVRTRDPAHIDKATVVVDVGATYEPEKHRYDHHQRTFEETYSAEYSEIKLSSAGLVFKHFGTRVVQALGGALEGKALELIIAKTYDTLVRELDAQDNGVSIGDNMRYKIVTHLGSRIGRLNPSWREDATPELENARFTAAMQLAAQELSDIVGGFVETWLPARVIVQESLQKRLEVHPSGELMMLDHYCPWQEHLFDLESECEELRTPLVRYVLYGDSRGGWRVQAAPKARIGFENRGPLPSEWCGVRDQALCDLSGIPGCVFVHASGFIGGNDSKEGALAMATKALELNPTESA